MKLWEKYYNKDYSLKAIYVVKTAMAILILGTIIYYLMSKTGSFLTFVVAVLKPLVLGMVFTYLLSPIVDRFENKLAPSFKKEKAARVVAVIITFIIVLAVVGLIVGLIVSTVTKSLSAFSLADIKEYYALLKDQFAKFWTTIEEQLASMNINLGSVGDMLGKIFTGVKSGASTLIFAVIFAIYFLLDEELGVYWGKVLGVFTSEETRAGLRQFAADADRVFSGYIRGQSIDAALVGLLSSVALLIAGVPYAIVIGILTGIGNLVPYVGPVVGFGSLIIVCLAEGSIRHLIIGGIILALVMFIDGNVINPRMLSSNVEVHPVLVIVALLAGGRVGGVVGMLVAVPVAALLKLRFEKFVAAREAAKEEAEAKEEKAKHEKPARHENASARKASPEVSHDEKAEKPAKHAKKE